MPGIEFPGGINGGNQMIVKAGGEIDVLSGGQVKAGGVPLSLNKMAGRDPVMAVLNTVTLAEVNAGKVILPEVAGVTYNILDFKAKVTGNFAGLTSILVQDTNTTPVVVATLAVAALTDGAVLNEATANVTMGAGFLGALTAGKGLKVVKSGSNGTTATSITVRILYTVTVE